MRCCVSACASRATWGSTSCDGRASSPSTRASSKRRRWRRGGAPDPLLRKAIEECRKALPGKPAAALLARIESAGAEPDALLAERLQMKLNTFLQNVTRARKLLAECLGRRGVQL